MNREMYLQLAKQLAITLASAVILVAGFLWLLHGVFGAALNVSGASIILGVIGTVLAFIGNSLAVDAVTRWGSSGLPHFKWGNQIQTIGFGLTIVALLVK
ncbi:hypothetical protein ACWDAZ_05400 [Streptomyces sp. NPDC001215]